MENNELTTYLSQAIHNILAEVLLHTLNNPKETAFLLQFRKQSKKSTQTRIGWEEKGQHVPAFLISSITDSCNLFCKGCYARNNGTCSEQSEKPTLSADKWENIFMQASELGINFHLLAGGEPLVRWDVIEKAATLQDTIFLIFTNGTMIDDTYCKLFDTNRNLVPVLSLEGTQARTDSRRGQGIYQQLMDKMQLLKKNKLLFGVSLTVTKENLKEVTDSEFVRQLQSFGCRVVFFIEYVPVDVSTKALALSEKERQELAKCQNELRTDFPSTLFLSFPGDEDKMGGCLAAGRGFFHINPYGEAEACPFSPYSDRNLQDSTLLEVLESPFFKKLHEVNLVGGEHTGGCVLFEQEEAVKTALNDLK